MVNERLMGIFILAQTSGGAPWARGGRAPGRVAERLPFTGARGRALPPSCFEELSKHSAGLIFRQTAVNLRRPMGLRVIEDARTVGDAT